MSPTPTFIPGVVGEDVEKEQRKNVKKSFPYEITRVDSETNKDLLKYFKGERTGFIQIGPKKWFFPSTFEKDAIHYYNFQARPDDVFVVTFPRSGTTWTQEMVWLLANELNYEKAASVPLPRRFPFLEFPSFVHKEVKKELLKENAYDEEKYQLIQNVDYPTWKTLAEKTERRFIKTHLPFSLLPPDLLEVGCKVIYVARNPKDVAVSFYHLNRLMKTQGYTGDFSRYWNYFENNLQPWTPYWEHLKEGWNCRTNENVLFLFYENINKVNTLEHIKKVSNFLGKTYSQLDYETLADHLTIENFRKNKSVNYDQVGEVGMFVKGEQGFVRKGKSGGWRDYFDEDLNRRADRWIEDNLRGSDIRFPGIDTL